MGAFRLSFHVLKPARFSAPPSSNTRFPPHFLLSASDLFFLLEKMVKANQARSFLSLNNWLTRSRPAWTPACPRPRSRPHQPGSWALSTAAHPRLGTAQKSPSPAPRLLPTHSLQGNSQMMLLRKECALPHHHRLFHWGTYHDLLLHSCDRLLAVPSAWLGATRGGAATWPAAEPQSSACTKRLCRVFEQQGWSNARVLYFYWLCLLPGTTSLRRKSYFVKACFTA